MPSAIDDASSAIGDVGTRRDVSADKTSPDQWANANDAPAGPDGGTSLDASVDTVSTLVGPPGGAVSYGMNRLIVPAGALAVDVTISITRTNDLVPLGYLGYSPIYRFEPAGLTFARPATVTFSFAGDPAKAAIFWSRASTAGFDRIAGTVVGAARAPRRPT